MGFEVYPCFINSRLARPIATILGIYSAFFYVGKCYRNNLYWKVRIFNRHRLLVLLNLLNELFKNCLTRNWFLHPLIDGLNVIILKLGVLRAEMSKYFKTSDFCKTKNAARQGFVVFLRN